MAINVSCSKYSIPLVTQLDFKPIATEAPAGVVFHHNVITIKASSLESKGDEEGIFRTGYAWLDRRLLKNS